MGLGISYLAPSTSTVRIGGSLGISYMAPSPSTVPLGRALGGYDPTLARILAREVEGTILEACCDEHCPDLAACETVCFPADWPNEPPASMPAEARAGYEAAQALAAARCMGYDHGLVAEFQRAASIEDDGVYGPATRGALRFFGISRPPVAVVGRGESRYLPPSQRGDVTEEPAAVVPPPPESATSGWVWGLGIATAVGVGVFALGRRKRRRR